MAKRKKNRLVLTPELIKDLQKRKPSNVKEEKICPIQQIKDLIIQFAYRPNPYMDNGCTYNADTIIMHVAEGGFGFTSDIAKTVEKYKRVSEKQAYFIAKAAVENKLNIEY